MQAAGRGVLQCRRQDIRYQIAHGQLRIVGPHGAAAGQDDIVAGALAHHVRPRLRAGNPLALAVRQRGLAVEADAQLHRQPRPPARHAADKAAVEFARLGFQQAAGTLDAGCGETCHALTGDQRIGIDHGRHHAPDSGLQQCIGAGGRAAEMAARLQRHVGRGAACPLAGHGQRMPLGMRRAGADVPALSRHLPVTDHDAAHAGIGRGTGHAQTRQLQGARHVAVVVGAEHAA